jgi:hypothetical protein
MSLSDHKPYQRWSISSPEGVRCSKCRHRPQKPSKFCEEARRTVKALGQLRKCEAYKAGVPDHRGNALETFDFASREFADLEQAERYVLKSFREFVWKQRQARQA